MTSSTIFFVFVCLVTTLTKATCDNLNKGPTIVEWPKFDPKAAANKLGDFVKAGNIDKVLAFFAYHTWDQRLEIVAKYNNIFMNKDVKDLPWDDNMDSLFKNDRDAACDMKDMGSLTKIDYLANRISHSFDENSNFIKRKTDYGYISILCTSTGDQIRTIIGRYQDMKDEALSEKLDKKSPESCKTFLKLLLEKPWRSDAKADDKKTAALANIITSLPDQKGDCAKNKDLFDMMQKESYDQIKAVGQKYEADSKKHVIDKIMLCEGDLGSVFTRIMKFSMSPGDYFAEELNNYITGQGDRINNAGPRIILSRSEIDLADIRTVYKTKYSADLDGAFKDKLKDSNQKLMKFLIDGNRDPKTFDSFK